MGLLSQLYNLDPQNTTVVRESVNWSDMRFRFLWKTKKAAGFRFLTSLLRFMSEYTIIA